MKKIIFFGLMVLVSVQMIAQESLPEDLVNICHTWGIEFPEHQDAGVRIEAGEKRFNQQFDVMISHRKEDYLVMTYFVPYSLMDGYENPALHSMMRATHFASNLEESKIAMHSFDEQEVKDSYGADWGAVYYFQPKTSLILKSQCQMVVLEKAGKGIFYTFYLFDEFSEDVEDMIWNPIFLEEG